MTHTENRKQHRVFHNLSTQETYTLQQHTTKPGCKEEVQLMQVTDIKRKIIKIGNTVRLQNKIKYKSKEGVVVYYNDCQIMSKDSLSTEISKARGNL